MPEVSNGRGVLVPSSPVSVPAGSGSGAASGAGTIVENVFLTPRVVDRAALDQYSSELRGLLERVAQQGESLRAASADADRLHKALREQGAKQNESLEMASRLAKTVSERVAAAEAMLAKASDVAGMVRAFEERVQQVIDLKMAAFETRLTPVLEQFGRVAQERVQQAAAQASKAVEDARSEREALRRELETQVRPAAAGLRDDVRKAAELVGDAGNPGALAALVQKVGLASEQAARTAQTLDAVHTRASESVQRLGASLDGAVQFSDRLIQQNELVEDDIRRALDACERAREDVRVAAEELSRVASPVIELERRADESVRRAERMLERVESARTGGQEVVADLARTLERMDAALVLLEPWRGVLLEERDDAALPGPVQRVVDEVRTGIAGDLSKMAAAMQLMAARATATTKKPDPAA